MVTIILLFDVVLLYMLLRYETLFTNHGIEKKIQRFVATFTICYGSLKYEEEVCHKIDATVIYLQKNLELTETCNSKKTCLLHLWLDLTLNLKVYRAW